MEWLTNLFFGSGIAHVVVIFSIVIALGIALGKVKVCGISLGITWILFVGIFLSHWGMCIEADLLNFIKEFGLILFVYSIGLQVGPGFFSAFKKGGLKLNMLAGVFVLLGGVTACVLHFATGLPMTTMVGILSGAVTNTPGLGAAQQAFEDMSGSSDPTIAMGYAVAYPLGVIGIILSIISYRYMFRINLDKEAEAADNEGRQTTLQATHVSLKVENPALFNKRIMDIAALIDKKFVISRILRENGKVEIAGAASRLTKEDRLFVIASKKDMGAIIAFIGRRIEMHRSEWEKLDSELVARRVVITRPELNGKLLGDLHLRSGFGVNITRVSRSGVDLVANPGLMLQMADRVTVVGTEEAISKVEKLLGNSLKRLREPNIAPIFLGIFVGILLGSFPIMFPGIPQPVKLGLAGGPLIVAILFSRFGPRYKLVTFTTTSANLMLREVGIALFLAAVGLGAGESFMTTIVDGGGYKWIGYGFIITMVPLISVGIIGRVFYKMNYYTLTGFVSGCMTDPPALAYSNAQAPNDLPAVGYATVYPLTMFLRILVAQLLILCFV